MRKSKKTPELSRFGKPALKSGAMALLFLARAVLSDLRLGSLKLRAAGLTYKTLLSLAPLLAISFSVLKGIGLHNQLEPFLLDFLSPLGGQGPEIAGKIVTFVDNVNVGVLGAVGFAVLIYSVITLMREIELAFNDIWRVKQGRSFVHRLRDYLGVLFIGPLFMSLSVAMTEVLRHGSLAEQWLGLYLPPELLDGGIVLVPYILFMIAFTALYIFMPNTQVKLIPALTAGVIAAVLWKLMGKLFGIFVAGSASYAAIYSVFAALMLFMIWIYTGWLVVLTGASIAYYLQNPSNQKLSARISENMSGRVRTKLALLICAEVGRRFYAGEKPMTLSMIAATLKFPAMIIEELAEALVQADILAMTGKGERVYIPGCPFDTITAGDMLKKLQAVDETAGTGFHQIKAPPVIENVLEAAFVQSQRELDKVTLKEIISGSLKA